MAKSAVRFRDSVAQFERLSADIAARRFAPVYLLMGDESYFIDALCDRLASTILGEAERSFNQIVLYGRDTSHPKWSVSIDSAFSSIRHPFEAMNPDSHGPIS